MTPARVLVTGGAGFVGSALALRARQAWPGATVIALDNLRRRGSELNLARLRQAGVTFVHGDIRQPADLGPLGKDLDLLLECSAEPSVLAGYDGDPSYVVDTNLTGTVHCLELARKAGAAVLFLSTSRVYPIAALNAIATVEGDTRFEIADAPHGPGLSTRGVAEDFPLAGTRSIYGATKLASELLIAEYHEAFGVPTIVNRCGVIAGPWQMGKVDQGVFSLWMARHLHGGALTYNGWNGQGKQVRDLLHVEDLADLVVAEVEQFERLDGQLFNVGGGRACSLSLRETTALCEAITGRRLDITPNPAMRVADIKLYLTDNARVTAATGWAPRRTPADVLRDLHAWMVEHGPALQAAGI
ncbi:3-beta hydroxysteroid dehydrogenase [Luteitalea sp. TBR-22]|uniref:NAD-dependent epimerase/dehydratase family protein n=1 Tax=Luteitalea sp. TBR-22 TaxID=2802971 RepID=UPI001AF75967|nr:NAD-dependent epimerase/dehydratase family protein [Luteitalea sp. TBR-22]BCS34682.1 3-beta hydroxysteroid dehydrogenase [Luteitalea sp. TBR-22]